MKNDPAAKDFTAPGIELYPHLKITNEKYPRVLATRRIEDDGAEYFGAFLTRTAVRILMGFLNRKFRLRTCDIPIDGNFSVPCTQYYHRRCIAPCVESLCDREKYLEVVGSARLFLANRRRELIEDLTSRMDAAAGQLDFETAAYWRDLIKSIEKFWKNPRWNVWLEDCVDTYAADETEAGSFIYLVTQRGRYVLGRKAFELPRGGGQPPHEAIAEIIRGFYRFHIPREIRVGFDFEERHSLARELSHAAGRAVQIRVVRPDRQLVTSIRALRRARAENDLDFAKQMATPRQVSGELKRLFSLGKLPSRVEAFDVAHISGKAFATASSVWDNGKFASTEYGFRISDETSELRAMADAVVSRLAKARRKTPDIILIDGGRPQLNAVLNAAKETELPSVCFVSAVKPSKKHSSVSRFISDTGDEIDYDPFNPAQNMLRLLRDDAHDLANRVHRDLRDMRHNYELASVLQSITEAERREALKTVGSISKIVELSSDELKKNFRPQTARKIIRDLQNYRMGESQPVLPLIVPIRFDDPDGGADDLRPIVTR